MQETWSEVLSTKKISSDTFIVTVQSPMIAGRAQPGQFVHVKCGEDKSYILRRPLSIHRVKAGTFDLFFKVRGKGTNWLSRRRKHDLLDIIGPLGKGFGLPRKNETALLVAGGMGVAPLVFLADELVKKHAKFVFAYGAKCRDELHFYIDVKRISHRLVCATDDGSYGVAGLITEALPQIIKQEKITAVYACGPRPMLAAVSAVCDKHEINGQAALEERMACGMGACLSCVCLAKDGGVEKYRRVCLDGPVFDFKDIVWQ